MVYIRRRMSTRALPEPTPELIRSRVRTLPKRFREASADGLAAEWELRVGGQAFAVSVADHRCSVRDGPAVAANTVITAQPDVWIAMDEGRVTGGRAFFEDRLAVRGNLDLAVRFQTLFRPFRRARKPADLDQLEVTVAGQRLSTYVMGSGPPLLDPALPGFRWRSIAAFTRVIPTELMAFPVPLRERWMELAIRQLFARPGSLPREVHAVAAREFVRIYREAAARMAFLSALRHLVIERPDPFFASLHRVKQPALVIFGERDRLVPPRLGVRLVQQLPDAGLVVLTGVGHGPP